MAKIDNTYHNLLKEILVFGKYYEDPNRKGVKRLQIPYASLQHNVGDEFPVITTKKMYLKGIIEELKWFLSGNTSIKPLLDNNINIWNDDAYHYHLKNNPHSTLTKEEFIQKVKNEELKGDCGKIYGYFWAKQLPQIIEEIKINPHSTRLIVNSWDNSIKEEQALPCCHYDYQFITHKDTLNLRFTMRSVDVFHGLPFNITSYALLLEYAAKETKMKTGNLYMNLNNVHIYENHIAAANQQLKNNPNKYPAATYNHPLEIKDYYSYPLIKAPFQAQS